jgi:tetratricopeptide (TPR) repeat protein
MPARSRKQSRFYSGAFLDGFHLTDAAEFERWVDDERSRLAGRLAHALRALASAAERQNDFRGAAEWLRRLAALDPLDTHVALRLMGALERAGDGAAALRHARVHQALRHVELELGEDPAIRAAADALAARLEAASSSSPSVGHSNGERERSTADEKAIDESASPSPSLPRRRRLGARHVVGAALAIVTIALAGRWATTARSTAARAADGTGPTGVAVFPFVVRGDAGDLPGDAMAVLLATKLDGGVGWRSIDPNALFAQYRAGPEHPDPADAARLARRLGADYFVLGDIVHVAGTVNLGAALYDARTGAPVFSRVGAQGASSALFALVDSLAARVLVGRSDGSVPQLARLASLTTSSLPALKEYLAGEAQVRAGRYADAAESFHRAIAADSTFALAYYRLACAYGWSGRASDKGTPLRMAARYGARLPEQIRLTVAAGLAVDSGNVNEAERMLRMVVARHPDGVDANYELGELLFHANPSRGISGAEAREPLERAVILDPSRSAEPLFHLVTIAALDGRARDVDSLITRLLQLHPEGSMSAAMRPTVALVRHDSSGIEQAARELAQLPTALALRNASLAIGMTNDPVGGARLLAALDRPSRPANDRARVVIALARLAAGRGDWVTADSLFARARTMDAPPAIDARARLLSLPIGDPPTESVRSARADLLSAREASQPRYRLLAGLLAVRLGEVRVAQATANELATLSPNDRANRVLWAELAARCFLAQQRAQEALAVLEGIRAPGPALRFLRGEVLESLGRNDEALRWYEVAAQDYGGELYASVIAKARARLAPARR